MSQTPPSASFPPAPSTEAALRKNQYEKETFQDAICIVGGIFIALLFIGIASYIVRYVASRPSNALITGEIVGLSAPKNHPIAGKLARDPKIQNNEPLEANCKKLNGRIFKLESGKNFTAYYRGNIGRYLAFELINVPELANCPFQVILTPAQARVARGTYTLRHRVVTDKSSKISFSEEELQSAETDEDSQKNSAKSTSEEEDSTP